MGPTTTTTNKRDENTADPGPNKKARTEEPPAAVSVVPPNNASESLRACIQKFGLQPPFSRVDDEDFWRDYFLERSLLEFRHEHAFDSNLEEVPHQNNCIEFPESVKELWRSLVADTPTLSGHVELPAMPPLCRESRADSPAREYLDWSHLLQAKIDKTLETTSLPSDMRRTKVYLLQYRVNKVSGGETARTVESKARLYSCVGTGESIDLTWYRHFRRKRKNANGELHLSLKCGSRPVPNPKRPCRVAATTLLASVECVNSFAPDEIEEIEFNFCESSVLKEAAATLFGPDLAETISNRKVFALLARASGAYHIGRAGSWVYDSMRKRLELGSGEESDEEEKPVGRGYGY